MADSRPAAVLAALVLALACDATGPSSSLDVSAADFAGHFRVEGDTVTRRSESSRPIRGTVVIRRKAQDAPHTVTFALETEFSTPEGPIEAEMIGSAEASFEGGALLGESQTQILMGTIPGIDPTFPYLPSRLGPRISSRFRMVPDPEEEGSFRIEIESEGVEGEQSYEATRTSLRAVRTPESGGADVVVTPSAEG